MPQENLQGFQRFYRWLGRFSFVTLLLSFFFLLFVLSVVINRLESLAPAEMRLLLELLRNRFFR